MALVSFTITDKVTKKEIANYGSSLSLLNYEDDDDYNEIKNKGLQILNQTIPLELNKRYKKETGNYLLFYLLDKKDTFYQAIVNQIHTNEEMDKAIFGLIEEVAKEDFRGQVDQYDNLTSTGKLSFNAMILRYQEMPPNKTNSARSETLDSLKRYQTSQPMELKDIKDEAVDVDISKPGAPVDISHTSLYGDNSKTTQFYFRIARGIIWSLSLSISITSIYLIFTSYRF